MQAYGSPLQLKADHTDGYQLVLNTSLDSPVNLSGLQALVARSVPGAFIRVFPKSLELRVEITHRERSAITIQAHYAKSCEVA